MCARGGARFCVIVCVGGFLIGQEGENTRLTLVLPSACCMHDVCNKNCPMVGYFASHVEVNEVMRCGAELPVFMRGFV